MLFSSTSIGREEDDEERKEKRRDKNWKAIFSHSEQLEESLALVMMLSILTIRSHDLIYI
jgi:hypothetical protein